MGKYVTGRLIVIATHPEHGDAKVNIAVHNTESLDADLPAMLERAKLHLAGLADGFSWDTLRWDYVPLKSG